MVNRSGSKTAREKINFVIYKALNFFFVIFINFIKKRLTLNIKFILGIRIYWIDLHKSPFHFSLFRVLQGYGINRIIYHSEKKKKTLNLYKVSINSKNEKNHHLENQYNSSAQLSIKKMWQKIG